MKKLLIYLVLGYFAIMSLAGCTFPFGGPTEHTFLQSRENVIKVEICTNSEPYHWLRGSKVDSLQPIVELSAEEINTLWDELLALPALEASRTPSLGGCGELVFVFSYTNGEQELIGFQEIGVLNADGTFAGYRNHVFEDQESLKKLFTKYAGPRLILKKNVTSEHISSAVHRQMSEQHQ